MANEELQGRFRAKAREWDFGESSKGSEQIAVQFQITEGDQKGRTLTWYGYFSDKTVERTLESMRFMGWSGEDPTNPTNLDANEVEIVVEPEDFTNDAGVTVTRSRVRWINRAGGLALKTRLDDAKKASLAERIRGHVAKVDQKLQAEGATADGKPKGDVPF